MVHEILIVRVGVGESEVESCDGDNLVLKNLKQIIITLFTNPPCILEISNSTKIIKPVGQQKYLVYLKKLQCYDNGWS